MVWLSVVNMARNRGPYNFFNRRKVFFLSAKFWGRKHNCYSVAVKSVIRSLQNNTISRKLKKIDMTNLRDTRIEAGCEQHGLSYDNFHSGLVRSDIYLNRKVLADLAVWEPRSFKALTSLAWVRAKEEGKYVEGEPPADVHLRGLLRTDKDN